MLRHISFPPWWHHLFEEIEGFLRSSFSRAIFSHTLVERHIGQVSNVPEKQVLHNRSYTSYMQLHILHVLQIQRTWDLPGMSQTWRWPCRSRRSRNTCILFQELESSLVSSRWFQVIGGSIDFYMILNQYGSNLSWSLLQCGFMAQATGVSSSGSGHKSSWTPWELENCKTSWESLKQINIFEGTPPSSRRAIWQRMEMFCLRIGTRSSCKLPSTDSDGPQDCLLSVREREREILIFSKALILVSGDKPLKRMPDHREGDGSWCEIFKIGIERRRHEIRLLLSWKWFKFFLDCLRLQTIEMLVPCGWRDLNAKIQCWFLLKMEILLAEGSPSVSSLCCTGTLKGEGLDCSTRSPSMKFLFHKTFSLFPFV